jgi:hypothetical protein
MRLKNNVIACRAVIQRAEDERRQRAERMASRRDSAAAMLGEEPAVGPACSLVRVRFPSGESSQRRFVAGATVDDVYTWVDSLPALSAWDYALASMYPMREFKREGEGFFTLEEAGLVPNAALALVVRDEE